MGTSPSASSVRILFLGRATLDILYRLDYMPVEDTKAYARQMHAAPGGPALNAAVTHALLGGQAMLISAVGSDPWAGPVRAELDRLGIHFLDLAAGTAYETPLCTVLVSAANSTRTIVNPPLTKVELCSPAPTWEDAVPSSWGAPPPVALVDGFFLPETLPLLTSLHAAGTCICLDAGSWKPGSGELAPLLSVAICSERFTIPGLDAGPDSLFAWFAARGVPFVAITRGARSILASDRGRRFEIEIEPIFTTDTLGAGDVLHGAFCHHFALAPEFEPALRKAAALATLSCKSIGIEGWVSEAKVSRS